MLRRLEIEAYGLIARADVEFADGATIFTGETGSGKTMLLGALGFVLGARADPAAVRAGARRASVTLTFDPGDALRERLRRDGFELDPDEHATISRELNDAGRSTVRFNGRPTTAAYVREIAEAIAEIVGQHEAQRLLSPAYHLELLDRFAGADALRACDAVVAAYARATELREQLEERGGDDRRARERYEDARSAASEIEGAQLEPHEDERLEERRRYLDNVERVASALRDAREALAGDEGGAIAALGAAATALGHVAQVGAELAEMARRAGVHQSEINDLATQIARALDATEFDPAELEAINARLDAIDRLKRKYGNGVELVLERGRQARAAMDEYEGRDERIEALRTQAAAAESELHRAAAALTALRRKAGARLTRSVVAEFADLALASGRFEAALQPQERIGPRGAERAEFLFAANAGEAARPLSHVASGGELSRVLLALIVVLADARSTQNALVFDEIDAGIGGATAAAVGARIGRLARDGQVVCVTHLAQLATWADRHYVLDKSERGKETAISVRELGRPQEREAEIARMLSGESHEIALRHARRLLAHAE